MDNNQIYRKARGIKFKVKQNTKKLTSLVFFQDVHHTNFKKPFKLSTRLEIWTTKVAVN